MEDSVGVEERREQSETTTPHKKARQEVAEAGGVGGGGGGKPAEEGGFLSAMASKIGATMSGTNGGSGGEVSATIASSDGEEGKRDGNGEPGEDGGFLSAMASKIGAAMSGANGGNGDGGGGNAAVPYGGEDKEADGSGGGGIFRKLLHSSPHAPSQASEAMETEEVQDQDMVAAEQGGILSAMATKIGMAMSGANGDDSHGGSGDDAKTSNGLAVGGDIVEEKKGEEANGGGILSAVASKIGVAVSRANGNGNHSSAEDDAKTSTGDAGHGSKGEEEGRNVNGGTIVEHIISNLPSDDQAPDADEASLLIAIIED